MRQLTIEYDRKSTLTQKDIDLFERDLDVNLPVDFCEIILLYAGCSIKECVYKVGIDNSEFVVVNQFLYLRKLDGVSVEDIFHGHKFYEIDGMIPFAVDPGGYDFNFSIRTESWGEIWINEFDGGDENSLKYVAPSLMEFINGLITQEDAEKLGH